MPTTVWTEVTVAQAQAAWDDGVTQWDGAYTWDPTGGITWDAATPPTTDWTEQT